MHKKLPTWLFQSIDDATLCQHPNRIPRCLRDSWSDDFIEEFGEDLSATKPRAILTCLAHVITKDTVPSSGETLRFARWWSVASTRARVLTSSGCLAAFSSRGTGACSSICTDGGSLLRRGHELVVRSVSDLARKSQEAGSERNSQNSRGRGGLVLEAPVLRSC